jgi:hypothetical protein
VEVNAIVMISDEAESWLRSVSASGYMQAPGHVKDRLANQD